MNVTRLLALIGILFVCSCTASSDGNRQDNKTSHKEEKSNNNKEQPVQEKKLSTLKYDHIIGDSIIDLNVHGQTITIQLNDVTCGFGTGNLCGYNGFEIKNRESVIFQHKPMERGYFFYQDTHEWPKLIKLPSGEYLLLGERYLGEPEGSVIDGYKFTKEALVDSSFGIGDDLTPLESLIKKME